MGARAHLVIRAKAPTFPDIRAGDPQTTPADLRYWTFCTGSEHVIPLVIRVRVRTDFEIPSTMTACTRSSSRSRRTGRLTRRPRTVWRGCRPGDPGQPDLVCLRHMMPSEEFFDQSVWAVPRRIVRAAEAIMGPYYPETTYCDAATFEEGGADACFAPSEATPAG